MFIFGKRHEMTLKISQRTRTRSAFSWMNQMWRVNEPDSPRHKYVHSCLHTVHLIETARFAPGVLSPYDNEVLGRQCRSFQGHLQCCCWYLRREWHALVMNMDSGARLPQFASRLPCLLAVWLWESYLTFLYLIFLDWKMQIIIKQSCSEDSWIHVGSTQNTACQTGSTQ